MHPDRRTVRMYRRSYGLFTRPDNQNTLTHWYADKNDASRDPRRELVTCNSVVTRPYSILWLCLCIHLQSVTINASIAPLCQEYAQCCIMYLMLVPQLTLAVLCWQPFTTGFDLPVFDLIRLNCFSIWFDSPVFWFDYNLLLFDLIRLTCISIWLDSPVFRFDQTQLFFDMIRLTCFSIWLDSIGFRSD